MKKYTHEKAHEEIDYIFKTLLPQRGMAERPEQIRLCHSILDEMCIRDSPCPVRIVRTVYSVLL